MKKQQVHLFSIQIELVLGDGGLPDALGEGGGLGVPDADVYVAGIKGAPGQTHLHTRETSLFNCADGNTPTMRDNICHIGKTTRFMANKTTLQ